VDFEECGGNLYALASLPGCAGTEITVAVDECWLLICGYSEHEAEEDAAEDLPDLPNDFGSAEFCSGQNPGVPKIIRSNAAAAVRDRADRRESPAAQNDERGREQRVPTSCAPRPFCVVALRAKVDPERSVAVLCNGLLAIRMGKAGLEAPVPLVV
jgi:HSP20 family molecular chaperone IbpA